MMAHAIPPGYPTLAIPPGSPPTAQQQQFATLPAGILVFEAPEQYALSEFNWIKRGAFELGYTDHIFMRGVVLSIKRYDKDQVTAGHHVRDGSKDALSEISPLDVVIGWQRMSDPAVISQIHIQQQDRFYYWRVENFPIPRDEIELSSTNVHLIPAHADQAAQLFALKPGDVVSLEGYLTDVKKPDGFIWNTSRVRDDHGDGACEIMLVQHISILQSLLQATTAP
jgi:hypothetical protein